MLNIFSIIVATLVLLVTIPAWIKDRSRKDADLYAIMLFAIDAAALLVFIRGVAAFL